MSPAQLIEQATQAAKDTLQQALKIVPHVSHPQAKELSAKAAQTAMHEAVHACRDLWKQGKLVGDVIATKQKPTISEAMLPKAASFERREQVKQEFVKKPPAQAQSPAVAAPVTAQESISARIGNVQKEFAKRKDAGREFSKAITDSSKYAGTPESWRLESALKAAERYLGSRHAYNRKENIGHRDELLALSIQVSKGPEAGMDQKTGDALINVAKLRTAAMGIKDKPTREEANLTLDVARSAAAAKRDAEFSISGHIAESLIIASRNPKALNGEGVKAQAEGALAALREISSSLQAGKILDSATLRRLGRVAKDFGDGISRESSLLQLSAQIESATRFATNKRFGTPEDRQFVRGTVEKARELLGKCREELAAAQQARQAGDKKAEEAHTVNAAVLLNALLNVRSGLDTFNELVLMKRGEDVRGKLKSAITSLYEMAKDPSAMDMKKATVHANAITNGAAYLAEQRHVKRSLEADANSLSKNSKLNAQRFTSYYKKTEVDAALLNVRKRINSGDFEGAGSAIGKASKQMVTSADSARRELSIAEFSKKRKEAEGMAVALEKRGASAKGREDIVGADNIGKLAKGYGRLAKEYGKMEELAKDGRFDEAKRRLVAARDLPYTLETARNVFEVAGNIDARYRFGERLEKIGREYGAVGSEILKKLTEPRLSAVAQVAEARVELDRVLGTEPGTAQAASSYKLSAKAMADTGKKVDETLQSYWKVSRGLAISERLVQDSLRIEAMARQVEGKDKYIAANLRSWSKDLLKLAKDAVEYPEMFINAFKKNSMWKGEFELRTQIRNIYGMVWKNISFLNRGSSEIMGLGVWDRFADADMRMLELTVIPEVPKVTNATQARNLELLLRGSGEALRKYQSYALRAALGDWKVSEAYVAIQLAQGKIVPNPQAEALRAIDRGTEHFVGSYEAALKLDFSSSQSHLRSGNNEAPTLIRQFGIMDTAENITDGVILTVRALAGAFIPHVMVADTLVSTLANWDELNKAQRGVSLALAAVAMVPVVGQLARARVLAPTAEKLAGMSTAERATLEVGIKLARREGFAVGGTMVALGGVNLALSLQKNKWKWNHELAMEAIQQGIFAAIAGGTMTLARVPKLGGEKGAQAPRAGERIIPLLEQVRPVEPVARPPVVEVPAPAPERKVTPTPKPTPAPEATRPSPPPSGLDVTAPVTPRAIGAQRSTPVQKPEGAVTAPIGDATRPGIPSKQVEDVTAPSGKKRSAPSGGEQARKAEPEPSWKVAERRADGLRLEVAEIAGYPIDKEPKVGRFFQKSSLEKQAKWRNEQMKAMEKLGEDASKKSESGLPLSDKEKKVLEWYNKSKEAIQGRGVERGAEITPVSDYHRAISDKSEAFEKAAELAYPKKKPSKETKVDVWKYRREQAVEKAAREAEARIHAGEKPENLTPTQRVALEWSEAQKRLEANPRYQEEQRLTKATYEEAKSRVGELEAQERQMSDGLERWLSSKLDREPTEADRSAAIATAQKKKSQKVTLEDADEIALKTAGLRERLEVAKDVENKTRTAREKNNVIDLAGDRAALQEGEGARSMASRDPARKSAPELQRNYEQEQTAAVSKERPFGSENAREKVYKELGMAAEGKVLQDSGFFDLLMRGDLEGRLGKAVGDPTARITEVKSLSGIKGAYEVTVRTSTGEVKMYVKTESLKPDHFVARLAERVGLKAPKYHAMKGEKPFTFTGRNNKQVEFGFMTDIRKVREGTVLMNELRDAKTPEARAAAEAFNKDPQAFYRALGEYMAKTYDWLGLGDRFSRNTAVSYKNGAWEFHPFDLDSGGAAMVMKRPLRERLRGKYDDTSMRKDCAEALVSFAQDLSAATGRRVSPEEILRQMLSAPPGKAVPSFLEGALAAYRELKTDRTLIPDLHKIIDGNHGEKHGLAFDMRQQGYSKGDVLSRPANGVLPKITGENGRFDYNAKEAKAALKFTRKQKPEAVQTKYESILKEAQQLEAKKRAAAQ